MQKASKTTESLFVGSYLTVEIEVNKGEISIERD